MPEGLLQLLRQERESLRGLAAVFNAVDHDGECNAHAAVCIVEADDLAHGTARNLFVVAAPANRVAFVEHLFGVIVTAARRKVVLVVQEVFVVLRGAKVENLAVVFVVFVLAAAAGSRRFFIVLVKADDVVGRFLVAFAPCSPKLYHCPPSGQSSKAESPIKRALVGPFLLGSQSRPFD